MRKKRILAASEFTELNSGYSVYYKELLSRLYNDYGDKFELGELAAAQTDTDKARDYFTRALETFESMKAAPDAARAIAVLESLK